MGAFALAVRRSADAPLSSPALAAVAGGDAIAQRHIEGRQAGVMVFAWRFPDPLSGRAAAFRLRSSARLAGVWSGRTG
jgi:hypothetical protein